MMHTLQSSTFCSPPAAACLCVSVRERQYVCMYYDLAFYCYSPERSTHLVRHLFNKPPDFGILKIHINKLNMCT